MPRIIKIECFWIIYDMYDLWKQLNWKKYEKIRRNETRLWLRQRLLTEIASTLSISKL